MPFVACGDLSGYDADACYELGQDYTPHEPVQPPLSAAYLDVSRKARASEQLPKFLSESIASDYPEEHPLRVALDAPRPDLIRWEDVMGRGNDGEEY